MPPVNLHAFLPESCPHGHPLRGRLTIIASYRPCACPGVQAAGVGGHQVVRCRACDEAGTGMMYIDPPHTAVTPRDAG